MLREAQDAVQDGAKLTAQLLAFGRRQPLNPKPTDVGPLVSNFAELLRRTLGEAIELSIVTTGSAHLAVVDAPQLQNALLNLAINARDAMPGGGRLTIEISHARLDADYAQMYPEVRTGRYVLIAVTDTGEGMPETCASGPLSLSSPPSRPERARVSASAWSMVSSNNPGVTSSSTASWGEGTTVRVFLPLAEGVRKRRGSDCRQGGSRRHAGRIGDDLACRRRSPLA